MSTATPITLDQARERASYLVECGFLVGDPHVLAEAMVAQTREQHKKDESPQTAAITAAPDVFCIQG